MYVLTSLTTSAILAVGGMAVQDTRSMILRKDLQHFLHTAASLMQNANQTLTAVSILAK